MVDNSRISARVSNLSKGDGVMKITNKRIAAQNRAARYLAQKQFEKTQKADQQMDIFMAFITGTAVAVIMAFSYEMYIVGGF